MTKILKNKELKETRSLQQRLDSAALSTQVLLGQSAGIVDKDVFKASQQATQIIENAHKEAEKIRSEAKAILEQVEEEVESKRLEGLAQGKEEGLAQATEHLIEIKKLREQLFSDNEREFIKLIFTIAEKVIRDEVSKNENAILEIIKQAIDAAMGQKVLIHINPEDYERVKAHESELIAKVQGEKTLILKSNEDVKLGGCIVESEIGTLDAQLDTQLTAIKHALGL